MRKLLAGIILVVLVALIVPTISYSADVYWLGGLTATLRDSTYLLKQDGIWRWQYHDTTTLHARDTLQYINLGHWGYNLRIRSYNPAGDSGYFKTCFGNYGTQGIWHDDSVARNLSWQEMGQATGTNPPDTSWLICPMEIRQFPIWVLADGTADSVCLIEMIYFR